MTSNYSRRDVVKGAIVATSLIGMGALAGCAASGSNGSAKKSAAASGTYAASAMGMKGNLTACVTIEDAAITKVEVLDTVDTPVIRDAAIDSICTRIVEQQNIEVDTVTGATMTSMGILSAVTTALTDAGVDTAPFKKGSDAAKEKAKGKTEDFDLVIVGSGMAGLNAAVSALHANETLKVLVLEKQAYTGGSTRVCGGGIWAVNAPVNAVAGQDSTKEQYISFMEKRSQTTELNTALMGNVYDASSPAFTYLNDWGLPISALLWNLGHPDCQLPCFDSTANMNADWETGNSGLADFMTKLAANQGVEVRLNSKVTKLNAANNVVSGVEVEDLESTYTVNAKKVILATGGFTRNADLIAKYAPEYKNAFAFTGSGSTGDGIVLTESLNTKVVGSGMMGLSGVNPSLGYYGPFGSLVWSAQFTINADGKDFGMKGTFYGDTLKLLLDQPKSCGYGIYDASNSNVERLEAGMEAGIVSKYETLAELAAGQGIVEAGLVEMAKNNKVSTAPFYCIVRKPLFIGSIPGLAVSEQCEVLDGSGAPIGNLYGAGELIYGNVFSRSYPASGTGVATSCYTGAIAAQAALKSA